MIEQKAREAAGALEAKHGLPNLVAFDPMTILALIEVVIEVIKGLVSKGQTPAQAVGILRKPGYLAAARIRVAARHATNRHFQGRPDLDAVKAKLTAAVRETGKATDETEMAEMFREVKTKMETEAMPAADRDREEYDVVGNVGELLAALKDLPPETPIGRRLGKDGEAMGEVKIAVVKPVPPPPAVVLVK